MPHRPSLRVVFAVFGLLALSSAGFAQDAACPDPKFTKKLQKPIQATQEAYNARNWSEMLAKVGEVEAVEVEKSAYDQFWIHEFKGIALANLKQYDQAAPELEAALNSPCMNEADKPQRMKLLMQIAYQSKKYPKAIEYGNRVYQANQDPEVGIYVANAYYIGDDFQNTKRLLSEVVAKQEAAGKTPEEQTYRILQSACLNLKDDACVNEQIEKLVAHYPKPNYWADLTNSLLRSSRNDKELLNILRLADGADALKDAAQYLEMAQLSMAQGLPGEAQAAIEKGLAKGAFTAARDKDHANRILAEARKAVTLDKSTLDKQDVSARAKTTGDADVKLGAAYLSYGDVNKAIEALQRGLGKGGVKNPDEANLLLGIAHRRSNNPAEAEKAFRAVSQDPAMARLARLWMLSKGAGSAAAPG